MPKPMLIIEVLEGSGIRRVHLDYDAGPLPKDEAFALLRRSWSAIEAFDRNLRTSGPPATEATTP